MKENQIWLRLKDWVQKIFLTWLPKFFHFAWTKVNAMNRGVNIMLKKPFFPINHPNWGNIKQNFADSFTELDDILPNLAIYYILLLHFYNHKQNSMVLNDIKWQIRQNFVQFCNSWFQFWNYMLVLNLFDPLNGKEATVNRALDGSTYPG